MMDLIPIAQAILVYTVLAVGVLATVLTGFAQLRELPQAWSSKPNPALLRRGFLAASVGMGSVGGSILALELAGPGAIGWMWIASLLGMGLIYAEVMVAVRWRGRVGGQTRAGMVHALSEGLPFGRGWGQALALVFGLAFMVFAIAAGSLLQTQQCGELLETLGGDRFTVAGFLVVAAAIGLLVPKLRASVVALGPVAIALYVIAAFLMIARAPGSATAALMEILGGIANPDSTSFAAGAAGGGVLMAMQIGFLRATLATEAGLGSAGFTPQADTSKNPAEAAAAAMLAPLVSGIVVPTLTVLMTLTASPWIGQRIDEPGERIPVAEHTPSDAELAELAAVLSDGNVDALSSQDRTRTMAMWAPLERPQSRGTAASLQAGQTVVLPTDAVAPEGAPEGSPGLHEDYVYPMIMRASPRGMKLAVDDSNAILLGLSEETQVISEVVYRDRDAKRAAEPAYDVRVPVTNTIIELGDLQYVRLTPAESGVDFKRMSRVRDGPYVVFGDFHFDARVVKMFQNQWGPHHALIEAYPDPGRPLSLRTTISSASFRGPYFDEGQARPPLAMVAREQFDAPVGARLLVEYRPPARGMEFGQLLASGELQTPPWKFLAETTTVVLRHKTDPKQDLLIPVTSKLVDGTLRFVSGRKDIADFAKASRWAAYTGPYLLPPPYQFEVEVHTGARFPASSSFLSRLGVERSSLDGPLADRRTLVAVHPYGEPQGSRGELYDPHPAEVAPFMHGPWVAGAGLARVGWAAHVSGKRGSDLLLAISVLILALTTMMAWAGYGARAADFVFGRGGGIGFGVAFLLFGLAGSVLSIMQVIKLADYAMLVLVLINGIGLTLLLLTRKSK